VQETRLWSPGEGVSKSMRSKESAHDYRYFPEPDLPPLTLEESYIAAIGEALPELPMARLERYGAELGLSQYDAMLLTSERPIADYFDAARAVGGDAKLTANWIASELLARLNRDGKGIAESPVSAAALGELVSLIVDKTISGKIAKEVFDKMWSTGKGAKELVAAEGLTQVTDEGAIETAAREVIDKSQKQAEQYRAGKVGLFGYFVGQTLKATGGRANPEIVNQVLRRLLDGQG
jgi:aspartyl-tRNA(Asn)/glutamyl-tRNA(Gln) amidotransferase subunit B